MPLIWTHLIPATLEGKALHNVENAMFTAAMAYALGLSLDQIFELHGERYYRRLERETFERLLAAGEPAVVAAAGGVVNESATWKMMLREATVVWLRAHPEDHWNRVIAQGELPSKGMSLHGACPPPS